MRRVAPSRDDVRVRVLFAAEPDREAAVRQGTESVLGGGELSGGG